MPPLARHSSSPANQPKGDAPLTRDRSVYLVPNLLSTACPMSPFAADTEGRVRPLSSEAARRCRSSTSASSQSCGRREVTPRRPGKNASPLREIAVHSRERPVLDSSSGCTRHVRSGIPPRYRSQAPRRRLKLHEQAVEHGQRPLRRFEKLFCIHPEVEPQR